MDPIFFYGIFLGVVMNTGESIIAKADGTITKARTMKRLPQEERLSIDMVKS